MLPFSIPGSSTLRIGAISPSFGRTLVQLKLNISIPTVYIISSKRILHMKKLQRGGEGKDKENKRLGKSIRTSK